MSGTSCTEVSREQHRFTVARDNTAVESEASNRDDDSDIVGSDECEVEVSNNGIDPLRVAEIVEKAVQVI